MSDDYTISSGRGVNVSDYELASAEPPLVEVLSIPVTTITSDPSKLRALIQMRHLPSPDQRERLSRYVAAWLAGKVQALILTEDAKLSFVLLDAPEPIIVEAK